MRGVPVLLIVAGATGLLAFAPAQDRPASRLAFEVASIRASTQAKPSLREPGQRGQGGCAFVFKLDRNRLDVRCATLTMLIGDAYRISPDRVVGPEWMNAARFDVAAKLPDGAVEAQVPEMLQTLLRERFQLSTHRDTKQGSVYALLIARGGLKMEPATSPEAEVQETGAGNSVQRWDAKSITAAALAELLDRVTPLSSPVVDRTGLTGSFRMSLEVSLREVVGTGSPKEASGDSMARENARIEMEDAALKAFNDGLGRLGLELKRSKGAIETVVVDRVEKSPSEN